MNLQSYKKLGSLEEKRVLVRATLDISAHEKEVTKNDTWRIDAGLPLLQELSRAGAKVVVMGHRGRPGGKKVAALSLRPVYSYIKEHLSAPVYFNKEAVGESAEEAANKLKNGEVLVLENLRFYPGEKENSQPFAKKLARLGDVYINNDFATSHRAHASIVSVPKLLSSAAGPLVKKEVETLSNLRAVRGDNLTVVLGGAKAETKIRVIEAFVQKGNKVLLGGVLANMFLNAEGYEVGRSVLADMSMVPTKLAEHENVFLPKDVVVSRSLKHAEDMRTILPEDIQKNEAVIDIGPQTLERFVREVRRSEKILWNGPLGLVEVPAFRTGTAAFARAFSAAQGTTYAGGGDLVTFLQEEGVRENIDVVLTAGGAMLSFLAGDNLPGLEALKS